MSMVTPRISIGLPVYNGEQFLAQTLDALLAQTWTDFELIISDNGSTDSTELLCRAYAARDSRIRYHRSASNQGGAWNFRRVVELATGAYFKWAAYDDLCAPTYLERCIAVLDELPEVVLCYPQTVLIDEQGAAIGTHAEELHLRSAQAHHRFRQFLQHYGIGAPCNVHYGLIRTNVLRQTPLLGSYVSSDIVLIGELALRGQFYEIPEPLFQRRDHPGTLLRTYGTRRAQLAWFDPSKQQARFPVWRLFVEHVRAIRRTPLHWFERLWCCLYMLQWLGWHVGAYVHDRRTSAKRLALLARTPTSRI